MSTANNTNSNRRKLVYLSSKKTCTGSYQQHIYTNTFDSNVTATIYSNKLQEIDKTEAVVVLTPAPSSSTVPSYSKQQAITITSNLPGLYLNCDTSSQRQGKGGSCEQAVWMLTHISMPLAPAAANGTQHLYNHQGPQAAIRAMHHCLGTATWLI